MRRLLAEGRLRRPFALVISAGLIVAVVLQRQTIVDAIGQLGSLSAAALVTLAVLGVLDRGLRAELMQSLLPGLSLARAEVVADVGAAATKGLPFGGPLGTVLRWQIAKERGIDAAGFLTMLVATGVAAAFVSWAYPLVATVVDMSGRSVGVIDLVIVGVCAAVLVGAVLFWAVLLRSDRAHAWAVARISQIYGRLASALPASTDHDPEQVVTRLRSSLRAIAARPFPLLARTVVAQANGALILWVALQGLGLGPELGAAEFARVFFVTHIIGSFAPTPGGVGLIEAGLTGALVAAGADGATALAAVLIYRFITYVLPILIGTALYLAWQRHRRFARTPGPAERASGRTAFAVDRGKL